MNENDPFSTDEDLAEGHRRLRKAFSSLDTRTGEILATHIALEIELDLTFEELFPNPRAISRIGFANKVRVLQAVYNDTIIEIIGEPLLAFDELRNSIAHRHDRRDINAKFKSVCVALGIDKDTATIQGIAQALTSGLVAARRELVPTS